MLEEPIEPDQITDYKVQFHMRVLESWRMRQAFVEYSMLKLWSIREECILALSVGAPGS